MKTGVLLVLAFIAALSPLSAAWSNGLFDPLRLAGIVEGRRTGPTVPPPMGEGGLRGFWNSSWPSAVARRLAETRAAGPSGGAGRGRGDVSFNISHQCSEDLVLVARALFFGEIWALKMVDASGKIPSGYLLGDLQWIGTYAECVKVLSNRTYQSATFTSSSIMGGYCLMSIENSSFATSRSLEMTLHLGICLPKTCGSADAKAIVNILLLNIDDKMSATGAECTDDSVLPLSGGACVYIVILCIFGVILLLGTCVDIISTRRFDKVVNEPTDDDDDDDDPLIDDVAPSDNSEVIVQSLGSQGVTTEMLRITPPTNPESHPGCLYRFLIAFSVVANTKKIFSTKVSADCRPLQALHGIRFVSMTWVILAHLYISSLTSASNIFVSLDYLRRFTFQAVMNASVAVDTFFLLSGTLVSYMLLKEIRSKEGPGNIRWARFFFHRFWRLTPLYMMVIAFYTTLFKYFGSGPYWPRTSDANCEANWWTNLLYINNIVRTSEPCMGWVWYLANDMQFFLLSPLFIVLLYKWALIGFIVISIFMLTSFITIGVITSVNHFPPSFPGIIQDVTLQHRWFHEVYITPWCKINPYLVGIVLGYILYKSNFKLKLPCGLVVLFWLLAAVCNLSVLYGLWNVSKGHFLSYGGNAVYASLHRTGWAVGVAWVILACATGNGGFINDLLSLPFLFPLSRLTYAAYLVHPIVMSWYFLNQKTPLYVDDITMAFLFVANVVFSYVSAFVVSIVCEAPMINLEKSFIRDRKNLEQRN